MIKICTFVCFLGGQNLSTCLRTYAGFLKLKYCLPKNCFSNKIELQDANEKHGSMASLMKRYRLYLYYRRQIVSVLYFDVIMKEEKGSK